MDIERIASFSQTVALLAVSASWYFDVAIVAVVASAASLALVCAALGYGFGGRSGR